MVFPEDFLFISQRLLIAKFHFYYSLISPAHLKANFATMTAKISLMTAAATIVPDIMAEREASIEFKVVTAIDVNTKDTPE